MWETIRGYLTFTRKERYGVLFLILLISALFISPFFFKRPVGSPEPFVDKKYIDGVMRFEQLLNDTPTNSHIDNRYQSAQEGSARANGYLATTFHSEMFYFDPNTLTAADWKNLGLRDHLIQTILHFVGKGGRFRQPADLSKLYGLRDADYQRLLPYVRIKKPPGSDQINFQASKPFYNPIQKETWISDSNRRFIPKRNYENQYYSEKKPISTDINKADSADWCKLPGIGAKLASRIVHFREKLGGFYDIEQVGETFGLPDSSFQKIKSCLCLNSVDLHWIDLNNASKEILSSHPYIRWQLTKAILDYRLQHGGFKSVDELQQIVQVDSGKYRKIRPYVMIKPETNNR